MAVETGENHLKDPLYQSAMHNLQMGNWREGLDALNKLIDAYPYSPDLRHLRQEMQWRAKIDADERVDERVYKRQHLMKSLLKAAIVVLFLLLVLWGVLAYSAWIQGQLSTAGKQLESQVQDIELAVKFRNGQNLALAGRREEAQAMFDYVAAINPSYPGLSVELEKIEKSKSLEDRYMQAIGLIDSGNLEGGLTILESIKAEDPYYKDVSIRIDEISNQFFLADLVAQAERAYQEQDWTASVAGFETIRAINPDYKQEQVEERLLNSYMNAAFTALETDSSSFEALEAAESYYRKALALRPGDSAVTQERERSRNAFREGLSLKYVEAALAALGDQGDSLEAMQVAEEYFRKAFTLTPNNPEVQAQYDLAKGFLFAQSEFVNAHYDVVIETLEPLYVKDPNYAGGTARQTLFEAYIARGNEYMAGGEYLLALNDYQRAAAIVEKDSQSILSLYTSKIKVAEAYGALTNYEDATFIYQEALDLIDLSQIKDKDFEPVRAKLEEAERQADYRYFRQAYRLYKDAAPKVLTSLATIIHTLGSEDYLTSLANRYNTTVEAIMSVNNLISPKQIKTGQELVIPGTQP